MSLYNDHNHLQTLLEDFYALTHLPVTVWDDTFCEIARYPAESMSLAPSVMQDAFLYSKRDRRTVRREEVAVTPIVHENAVIGYMMIGKSAAVSDAQLTSAIRMAEACAGHLSLAKLMLSQSDRVSLQINTYIEEHLAQPLSTDLLCREFKISKNRLYAIASRYYGKGVMQHIGELRIARAKQLLRESDRTVGEVADACGFSDYNYFTKVFKRHTGQTPRDFRKSNTSE